MPDANARASVDGPSAGRARSALRMGRVSVATSATAAIPVAAIPIVIDGENAWSRNPPRSDPSGIEPQAI